MAALAYLAFSWSLLHWMSFICSMISSFFISFVGNWTVGIVINGDSISTSIWMTRILIFASDTFSVCMFGSVAADGTDIDELEKYKCLQSKIAIVKSTQIRLLNVNGCKSRKMNVVWFKWNEEK